MPNDITYELTEEKNLVESKEGLTQEELDQWKIDNFGNGKINVSNGTAPATGTFSFYIGEGNVIMSGMYTNTYEITTNHGLALFFNNYQTISAGVKNSTSSSVYVTSIPLYRGTIEFSEIVNISKVQEIKAGESQSVTPTGTCSGALIFW